jgi:hypothetical protein
VNAGDAANGIFMARKCEERGVLAKNIDFWWHEGERDASLARFCLPGDSLPLFPGGDDQRPVYEAAGWMKNTSQFGGHDVDAQIRSRAVDSDFDLMLWYDFDHIDDDGDVVGAGGALVMPFPNREDPLTEAIFADLLRYLTKQRKILAFYSERCKMQEMMGRCVGIVGAALMTEGNRCPRRRSKNARMRTRSCSELSGTQNGIQTPETNVRKWLSSVCAKNSISLQICALRLSMMSYPLQAR